MRSEFLWLTRLAVAASLCGSAAMAANRTAAPGSPAGNAGSAGAGMGVIALPGGNGISGTVPGASTAPVLSGAIPNTSNGTVTGPGAVINGGTVTSPNGQTDPNAPNPTNQNSATETPSNL